MLARANQERASRLREECAWKQRDSEVLGGTTAEVRHEDDCSLQSKPEDGDLRMGLAPRMGLRFMMGFAQSSTRAYRVSLSTDGIQAWVCFTGVCTLLKS